MMELRWLSWLRPQPSDKIPAVYRLFAAAVTGAALALSFTGWYLSIYSWVSLSVLIVVLFGARARVAFACGFLHAFVFVLCSVSWLGTVLHVHGGLSRLGGIGVLLLISAAWGTLTGLFAWCVNRIARRSVLRACVAAPFLWVAFEFVRTHLPAIGFPWNLLGYPAAANLALVQLTAITGIYGLSFVVAAVNALLAWVDVAETPAVSRRFAILGGAIAAIVLVMLLGPRMVPQARGSHYARVVQPNFPEALAYEADWFQRHAAELDQIERWSLVSSPLKPDVVVWPEEPAPFSFQDVRFAKRASSLAQRFGGPFLAGVIEWKPVPGAMDMHQWAYNSAILVDRQGQRVWGYDKIHLVPFGEYEPFPLIHRLVTSLSDEVGGFHAGSQASVGTLPGGGRFSTFICYEAIFPGEVRRFAANGAQVFFNLSNDGWFGRSAAPEQHLRMARVRAVENRRWLVRSTNNGYTVSFDPYGRIVARLTPDTRTAGDLPYDFRTDMTLYTRFGDWFAWLCVLVSAGFLAASIWKCREPGETAAN